VVAILVLAGIIAQPFLIGLWLFGAVGTSDLHATVGYSLFTFGTPLLLITGLLARLPRNDLLLTLLLMVELVVQELLVGARDSAPAVAALHPLNAFAMLLIAITVVRRDRDLLRETTPATSA
jgi:hypothetical protein